MNRTMLQTVLLIFIAAGGSADASGRPAQTPPTRTPTAPPKVTRQEVIALLDCVECDAVLKKLAPLEKVDSQVVSELRDVLLNGPSQDRLDRQQRHLKKTYDALKEYARQHPPQKVPLSEGEYVQLYGQKYILLNRTRAARALGAIGTPLAKAALTEALKSNPPPELRRDVELALKVGAQ
jgi:hypothetical protein